jgi:hypothetical protein
MGEWLKQNGGPPAIVVVGAGLVFAFWPVGVALIVVGVLMYLSAASWFPWEVVAAHPATRVQHLSAVLPLEVTEQVLRLDQMPPMVVGRTFSRCELVGPTPALIAPSERVKCRWLGQPTADSFRVVRDLSKLPRGTVQFIECRLVDCDLQSFTTVGTRLQIEQLRREFVPAGIPTPSA